MKNSKHSLLIWWCNAQAQDGRVGKPDAVDPSALADDLLWKSVEGPCATMRWIKQDCFATGYFASVLTTPELMRIGIKFIVVVKTATEVHRAIMMAYAFMDRDRRHFISTSSTLELPYVNDSLEKRRRDTKGRSQSRGPGDSATFGLRNLLFS